MKYTKHLLVGLLSVLFIVSLVGCGGGAPDVEWELNISGAVSTPATLTYAQLTEMTQIDLADVLMEKSLGENETDSWSGVPVDEIFTQAGVGDYTTITGIAADGYAIEITQEEMQGAIVALKKNGEWIVNAADEAGKGPIRLVCPETPANRWLFQLTDLQVNE